MKYRMLCTVGVIVLGLVVMSTIPVEAQMTAPGPYYATPSWDQKLPASTRFIVLSNWNSEAVLDRETGLVWERSPSTEGFDWQFAIHHCTLLSKGNRMGWRLPTVQELASLIDTSVSEGRKLPTGHPFVAEANAYWSATSSNLLTTSAWTVSFVTPSLGFVLKDPPSFHPGAWCVRGGQGVDVQ